MKKNMKIATVYLLFGVVFPVIITASYGYKSTVINPTIIGLSFVQYVMAMLDVITLRFLILLFLFFSNKNHLSFSKHKIVLGGIYAIICTEKEGGEWH